jgi:hypothetical protein
MVRGCREGSQHGARGGGAMTPITPASKGSNPQGEQQVIGHDHIFVWDMARFMRSYQRISEALARVPIPPEGPQRTPTSTSRIH